MIKFFAYASAILAGTFCAVAPAFAIPGQIGVSSGTTIQSFESNIVGNSQSWGSYNEIGLSVNSGVAGSGGLDLTFSDPSGALSLTQGGVAGINLFSIEGGFTNESVTRSTVTGSTVTSFTNFN